MTRPVFQGILNTNNTFKVKIDQMEEEKVKMIIDINEKSKDINDMCEKLQSLQQKTDEHEILLENVQRKGLRFQSISGDDRKIKFYTGLPNCATFIAVYDTAAPHANRKNTKLDQKDELLMTLIK